jgi:hypothetical protein
MSEHAITVAIALLSVSLAAISETNGSLAGLIYFLMPICQGLNGWRNGVKVTALAKLEEQSLAAADASTLPPAHPSHDLD